MDDFLRFISEKVKYFPMHIEITYNKTCDWQIYVYKQGCAEDYPESESSGKDAIICSTQDGDIELAFAKAQCEVKEWLSANEGGY